MSCNGIWRDKQQLLVEEEEDGLWTVNKEGQKVGKH